MGRRVWTAPPGPASHRFGVGGVSAQRPSEWLTNKSQLCFLLETHLKQTHAKIRSGGMEMIGRAHTDEERAGVAQ